MNLDFDTTSTSSDYFMFDYFFLSCFSFNYSDKIKFAASYLAYLLSY